MLALPPPVPAVVNTLPVLKAPSWKLVLEPSPMASPAAALAANVGTLIVIDFLSAATAVMVESGSMRWSFELAMLVYTTDMPTSVGSNDAAVVESVVAPFAYFTFVTWRPGVPIAPTATAGKV